MLIIVMAPLNPRRKGAVFRSNDDRSTWTEKGPGKL
jgi:hypothetical protein